MPGKPRFNLSGIPQYIIKRGNNREPCFVTEKDYQRYLDDLDHVLGLDETESNYHYPPILSIFINSRHPKIWLCVNNYMDSKKKSGDKLIVIEPVRLRGQDLTAVVVRNYQ